MDQQSDKQTKKQPRFSNISEQQINDLDLPNNVFLVEVMEQSNSRNKEKDIFDQMAFQEKSRSVMQSPSNSDRYESRIKQEKINENMYEPQKLIRHSCQCMGDCVYSHCPCSQQGNEQCLQGVCCPVCIMLKQKTIFAKKCISCREGLGSQMECQCTINKQQLVKEVRQLRNPEKRRKKIKKDDLKKNENLKTFKVCLCKKSHCLKRYCECYAAGIKCNAKCQCNECENCDLSSPNSEESQSKKQVSRGRKNEDQIERYLEEKDYSKILLPRAMEFLPFDFKEAHKR